MIPPPTAGGDLGWRVELPGGVVLGDGVLDAGLVLGSGKIAAPVLVLGKWGGSFAFRSSWCFAPHGWRTPTWKVTLCIA